MFLRFLDCSGGSSGRREAPTTVQAVANTSVGPAEARQMQEATMIGSKCSKSTEITSAVSV